MSTSSARLIELLALLQSRRSWSGEQLARRLGVSTRTIRSNIAQLRDLGFPVEATPGATGGYELGAGSRMAPLLLEDDEAVATAVALRTVTATGLAGIEDAAVRALAKLAQVLPDRLRSRIDALQDTIEPLHWGRQRLSVSPEALLVFSQACRDRVHARFDYVDKAGTPTRREVEPHALVPDGARWYLVAFDLDRDDWRTFRVDRTDEPRMLRRRSARRELPAEDAAAYVRQSITGARPRQHATVHLRVDADAAREALGGHVPGELHPEADGRSRLEAEVEHLDWLVFRLTHADLDFEVDDGGPLAARLAALAARFTRATTTDDGPQP